MTHLFELDGFGVAFDGSGRSVRAVRDVSFAVDRGETLGIVGESGSGKSVSLLASFGLLGANGRIVAGEARFDGTDIARMPPAQRRRLLGAEVAFIFQNPVASLDPVLSIGAQLVEALRIHNRSIGRRAATRRAAELLTQVGITEPQRRLRQYPHEFSGGMCQRVMIAMAIANRPKLIIADEPTTAVDMTIQQQILALLRTVRAEVGGAIVLVSHDLGVIAENSDRVVVMYGGAVMETGATGDVLANPRHPYTQGLLSCRPSLGRTAGLVPIPGQPPSAAQVLPGCPFTPRCPIGRENPTCRDVRPALRICGESQAACHYAGSTAFSPPAETAQPQPRQRAAPLIQMSGIVVAFPLRRTLWERRRVMRAVDGVDLAVERGEALGIVGESGSGKSTLARVLMRLIPATSGRVVFDGTDITDLGRDGLSAFRDRVQMVFQDPYNSLNPRLSIGDNAAEPLRLRAVAAAERRARVLARFAEVGLRQEHHDRWPGEMSGGQLQRVGIARALVLDPDVLVMDEPVSALDVSVQAQILNLLKSLKERRSLSYVFISHDMSVVRYLCDRVAVMHLGRLVEVAPAGEIFSRPQHPYTKGLLAAVPDTASATRFKAA